MRRGDDGQRASATQRKRPDVGDATGGDGATGQSVGFDCDLDLNGVTDFRRRVLEVCAKIPRGQTASYADLARAAGNARAVRAVGSAMANNPLPLLVPCHRVIRSDGSLGGFSSPDGLRLKQRMLSLEGASFE